MDPPLTRDAVERLFVAQERPLFNVVYRWVWQRDDAAEIVQEAFVRLWHMRSRVDPEGARALLYRIALNLAASRRRRSRVRRLVRLDAPVDGGPRPDLDLDRREDRDRVRRAIETLPEGLRRVVVLCELSELPYAEIAGVLGIKPGTVGSRRHAAMHRLRRALHGRAEVAHHDA